MRGREPGGGEPLDRPGGVEQVEHRPTIRGAGRGLRGEAGRIPRQTDAIEILYRLSHGAGGRHRRGGSAARSGRRWQAVLHACWSCAARTRESACGIRSGGRSVRIAAWTPYQWKVGRPERWIAEVPQEARRRIEVRAAIRWSSRSRDAATASSPRGSRHVEVDGVAREQPRAPPRLRQVPRCRCCGARHRPAHRARRAGREVYGRRRPRRAGAGRGEVAAGASRPGEQHLVAATERRATQVGVNRTLQDGIGEVQLAEMRATSAASDAGESWRTASCPTGAMDERPARAAGTRRRRPQ